MSSNRQLPLELRDMIIDELSDETESPCSALRACLFVSRSFRKRARRHIFSKIQIEDAGKDHTPGRTRTDGEMTNRLKLLIELMRPPAPATIGSDQARLEYTLSQGILPYVRRVHFGFCDDGLYISNDQSAPLYPESARYAIDILWMLAKRASSTLQNIEIDGAGPGDVAEWTGLVPHVRFLLLHLCRVASSEITLRHMTEVPSTVLRGARNKHIIFEDVVLFKPKPNGRVNFHAFPEHHEESMGAYSLPDLHSAHISDLFDDFCDQIYPMDEESPHLDMKTIQLRLLELNRVAGALDRVSDQYPNLEALMLDLIVDADDNGEVTQFNIQNMVSLKKLALDVEHVDFNQALASMASILEFCSNPTLSTIRLSPASLIVQMTVDGFIDVDMSVLSVLDRLLSDRFNFPSLQCVIFHVKLDVKFPLGVKGFWGDKEAILKLFFRRAFPCLELIKSRVKLIVEFERL